MTNVLSLVTIVTLYQAGNGIYDLFDKVLVLDKGKQIFYGLMEGARPFMEDLGFVCDNAANTSDFLTSVTVPTERHIQDGFESRFPRTATAIYEAYEKTLTRLEMQKEYDYSIRDVIKTLTKDFKEAVQDNKDRSLPGSSPLMVGFLVQVRACITRQYQIL